MKIFQMIIYVKSFLKNVENTIFKAEKNGGNKVVYNISFSL